LKGLETLKIGGQLIHSVKYADDLVLLADEEMILQGFTDTLVGIRRCCGMENIYVEESKVMRTSRQPPEMRITTDNNSGSLCDMVTSRQHRRCIIPLAVKTV